MTAMMGWDLFEDLRAAQEEMLRLVELPLFEQDQPEVGVEDEDVGILGSEASIDHFSFRKRVGLEVDQAEEVQDIRVIGSQPLGVLQFPPPFRITPFLKGLTPPVVVEQKDTLVERWRDGRVSLRIMWSIRAASLASSRNMVTKL